MHKYALGIQKKDADYKERETGIISRAVSHKIITVEHALIFTWGHNL